MKAVTALIAIPLVAGIGAFVSATSSAADEQAAPFLTETVNGYRDWKLISVAHEEGDLNDLRAQLGNEIAIKAYREGTLPFPEGSVIVALHWNYVASKENNKVFGRAQSFVAGAAKNIQFIVKDSTKYGATGGWGFGDFKDDKLNPEAKLKTCFPCHQAASATNFVFSHYSP